MKCILTLFKALSVTSAVSALLLLSPQVCWGHAMPDHTEPGVGATLDSPPEYVRIWFDDPLEPGLCSITVKDSSGNKVDMGDSRVNPDNHALLETSLKTMQPGIYHIFWSAVSGGGHKTSGDYTFKIK